MEIFIKKLALTLTSILAITTAATFAPAIAADRATLTMDAVVITPLNIQQIRHMHFGYIYKPASGSTSRGASALFKVTGEANANVRISYPTAVSMSSGTNRLTVRLSGQGTVRLPASGSLNKYVPGLVHVASTTAKGRYAGRTIVTATYL